MSCWCESFVNVLMCVGMYVCMYVWVSGINCIRCCYSYIRCENLSNILLKITLRCASPITDIVHPSNHLHLLTPGHIHRGNGITWRGFTQTTIKIWFDAGKFQKIKIMVCTCVYIHICQIRFSGAFGREWWESKWGLWGWKFHHLHYSRSFRMIARARMCFTGEGWRLVSWCPSGSKTMYSWFYLFIRIWIIFCVCFVV